MATTDNRKTKTGARTAVEEVAPQHDRTETKVKPPEDAKVKGVGTVTHPTPPPPNVDEPLADEASGQPEAGEGGGATVAVTTSDDESDEDEGEEPIAFDIRPDFESMDEDRVLKWFRAFTKWLRQGDAVVRGPETTEVTVDTTSNEDGADQPLPVGVTGEASTKSVHSDKDKDDESVSVFETFYEWENEGNPPITIKATNLDRLQSVRDAASTALHRRNEV